jgi:peptidoglycan/LPS O-acetylase OafA/YrhL
VVSQTKQPAARPGGLEERLPYLPGIDGLRALAVTAVVLYHAQLEVWGGFLGVEAFFVISGYLITSLLLAEWFANGRVSLTQFWAGRARRLLPALFTVIAATLAFAFAFLPEEAPTLLDDTLASLGYVMNWLLVFSQQSYFDPMVRPSLLQHLWSLAVEEQFYLLWPPLFLVGIRFLGHRGLLAATLVGAAGSVALMVALFQPDADPSRVYYGTDTRASALLIGAALAMVWSPARPPLASSTRAGNLLDGVGLLAVVGLLASFMIFDEYHQQLYPFGFLAVSLTTAVAMAAVAHPQARLVPWALGLAPLRWLGLRSYGVYLWHWPIFMVTRPFIDVQLDGWPLLLGRLLAVALLAELSYRLIEMPVRRGALGRLRRRWLPPSAAASKLDVLVVSDPSDRAN